MTIHAVVLAAGQGTRMRSSMPKVLHPILGQPLAAYALEAARLATGSTPVMVVGHQAEEVQKALGASADYVVQEPQLGTGHAVLQAEPLLKGKSEVVLVTYADMPLLTVDTLKQLIDVHHSGCCAVTMLTMIAEDPRGFGRVVRDTEGRVQAIVEEASATPEQLAIRELNTGVYCFDADWLWHALKEVKVSPKGEYYLTDLAGMAVTENKGVQALAINETSEMIGINNRIHLWEAENAMRARINRSWMLEGVTIIDPNMTYIESGVTIGRDTVIWPNCYLQGNTEIGESCVIGPNTIIRSTKVGRDCTIEASVLESALVEDDVEMGPFAHLRKGAHLASGVHMGNFGEVKNSYLGPGTKMGHFSYLGDANIGTNVNIGAGTITCNFDGVKKHPTEIGENAFIGSDTMLVAPVKIGEGARTGAGSVVTKNIEPYTLAVGVPARAIRKLEKHD
ncbi:MAG: UDP-N-acetylglucosamine diphosphorylase/glucosamine-1-phosphate N-acetyltransferase [Chloroflexi bacterium]|nr:MAG: UDP-N-acetylglucosamine diphosphorylase/glucosamine-1-phosphate N-acetyltransferase [Chloroflexota bacterium]